MRESETFDNIEPEVSANRLSKNRALDGLAIWGKLVKFQ